MGTPSATFVSKMEDVLEVYQRPYHPPRPVVCIDETSKEWHQTPRGSLVAHAHRPERHDDAYARMGTRTLFLAVEPLCGWRQVRVSERRTAVDVAEQLRQLVDEVDAQGERVVLVTDNVHTHTPAWLYERVEPAEARRIATTVAWQYTPEHGRWRTMAECEVRVLARHGLGHMTGITYRRNASTWLFRNEALGSHIVRYVG